MARWPICWAWADARGHVQERHTVAHDGDEGMARTTRGAADARALHIRTRGYAWTIHSLSRPKRARVLE